MLSAKPMAEVINLHLRFPLQASPAGKQREVAPTREVAGFACSTEALLLPHHGRHLFQLSSNTLRMSANGSSLAIKLRKLHSSAYIACQSNKSDAFIGWNEDLFFLVTQESLQLRNQGFIVLSLGNYNTRVGCIPGLEENTPDLNKNSPMFLNFLQQVSLLIINTLPISQGVFTRFMDQSGQPGTRSLLDFGLIDADKANTVTSFIIDENARFACGTDHALLECKIELRSKINLKWEFQDVLQ